MIACIVFYNISSGPQSWLSFSKEFKHCNLIVYDGLHYMGGELDYAGIRNKIFEDIFGCDQLADYLKSNPKVSSFIFMKVKEKTIFPWRPFIIRSCNEITRYMASLDIGFTFNPVHLYKKLLKWDHKRNYEILLHWRR